MVDNKFNLPWEVDVVEAAIEWNEIIKEILEEQVDKPSAMKRMLSTVEAYDAMTLAEKEDMVKQHGLQEFMSFVQDIETARRELDAMRSFLEN